MGIIEGTLCCNWKINIAKTLPARVLQFVSRWHRLPDGKMNGTEEGEVRSFQIPGREKIAPQNILAEMD